MVICHCERVNERTIRRLIRGSEVTIDEVIAECGAGGRCGGCRNTIEQMLLDAGVKVRVAARAAG